MFENLSMFYAFWILISHCCDESRTLQVTSPVQTFVGWNASFSLQLDPYPNQDLTISIIKNISKIMLVRGTGSKDVAERFQFTGNTSENRITFILRNVTLGDAGTYTAIEAGSPTGEQKLIVKVSPSRPQIIELTGFAVSGSDYRLNCSSMSNSVPPDHGLTMIFEWKLNGQIITTGGHYKIRGTELIIENLTRQDNGAKLTCITYEDSLAKSVPSNEHVIDVKYGPDNVQLNPSGGIIRGIENNLITISCMADCNPTCSFQWRRVSVPGYLRTKPNLMIDSVGKSDADNYTCNVSNSITSRSIQSIQTTLVAIYGPDIGQVILSTSQSSLTVEDNTMLNITCSADCYPPCSVTWTGPQGFLQSGAQLSRVVDRNKGGNYICTASNQENSGKSATASVTVTVMYGPGNSVSLGSNPPAIIVNLHQRVPDITCSAICNPQCDYRWYYNRTLYSNGATLSLGVVENKTSRGNYTCEAYNRFLGIDRSSSASVNIIVYYAPEVKLQPSVLPRASEYIVKLGQINVGLSCVVTDANPSVQWFSWTKDGKLMQDETSQTVNIAVVTRNTFGKWGCKGVNSVGIPLESTLDIDVHYGPIITSMSNLKIVEGELINVSCMVDSRPSASSVYWTKSQNNTFTLNKPDLYIFHLNRADKGTYECTATNTIQPTGQTAGERITAKSDFSLDVTYVPGVPSNITITEVTKNSLTVQWVAGYNGGIQQTFYVVASAGDFTWNVTASDPGYRNIGTVMMKGLAASTKYSISMSASNLIGSSSMTEAIFVITLEELPSPVIRDFPVAAVAGGVVGAIVLVIVIVAVVFVVKRWTLKPKMKKKIEKVVFDGKGPEYVNTAFRSDISTTEYEALQYDRIGETAYEALNDTKSKLNQSTDIRISSDPIPSTGDMFYDKLYSRASNQGHMYSSLSSQRLDEGESKCYENTVIVNKIHP